jgi:hypothetical protein
LSPIRSHYPCRDGREASVRGIVRPVMAVATERDYGLFINGELT